MKALISKFWQPGRAVYSAAEYFIMRVLFAWVLFGSFRLAGYNAFDWFASKGRGPFQPTEPRSIAQFMDVTWIIDPAWIPWFAAMVCGGLVLLILGVMPVLSAGLLLFLHMNIGALENSTGKKVDHASQLLCFVLLAILLAGIYDYVQALRHSGRAGLVEVLKSRWSWLAYLLRHPGCWIRRAGNHVEILAERSRSRAVYTVQQLIAAGYVVSGISKLWISKGKWIQESENIHLQFLKNQKYEYYETLNPNVATPWAIDFVMNYPVLAKCVLACGLLLEVFCFVALANRVSLLVFGISLILMHHMIAQLMSLFFDFNIWCLWIWYVNVPFCLIWLWKSRGKKVVDAGAV
jgi:hypothetical protein